MIYNKIPVVIFLSITLIFSLYSNIPSYAASTALIYFKINGGADNIYPDLLKEPYRFTTADSSIIIGGTFDRENACKHKGFNDFIYNFANIYIIQGIPSEDQRLTDVSGEPNVVGGFSSLTFDEETIGFLPPSGNGLADGQTYTIVIDNCQDEHYNSDEDKFFANAFTIDLDYNTLPIRHHLLTDVEGLKEGAKFKELSLLGLERGGYAIIGSFTAWVAGQCGASILYTKSSETSKELCTKMFAYVAILGKFVLATKINPILSLQQKYKGLAADPPDLNYRQFTTLAPIPNFESSSSDFALSNSMTDVRNQAENEAVLVEALTRAIERYDGSLEDGNPKWAVKHLNEIKNFANLLEQQITITDNTLNNQLNEILLDNLNVTSQDVIEAKKDQLIVKQTGFNSTQIRDLKNFGFSDSEIKDIKNAYLSFDPTSLTDAQLSLPIKNVLKYSQLLKSQLQNIISEIDETKNEIMQEFPFLTFDSLAMAGGPYYGRESIPITFTAGTITQNNSLVLSYEWDLDGDGVFNDGNSTTTSFIYNNKFDGYIGLKVTSSNELMGVDYAPVHIESNNRNPIFTSFSPDVPIIKALANNVSTFTVTTSDPDQDPVNTQWSIDNQTIHIGESFDYIPNDSDLGSHIIKANVIDTGIPIKNTFYEWIVFVVLTDSDKDLWNSNVDCNDDDSSINPGAKEIYYNGIDDDCNLSSLDHNSPPIADNQTISISQNVPVSITFTAIDVDNDRLNFSIIDSPENGTLSDIMIDQFSGIASATYTPNPNFHGTDKLTFIVNDGNQNSTIGTINIDTLISIPPVTESRSISMDEDTSTDIELNTTASDGHQLQFELLPVSSIDGKNDTTILGSTTSPHIIDHDSAITRYTPLPNYHSGTIGMGEDGLIFNVLDPPLTPDQSSQSQGQINIHINPVNDAPFSFSKTIRTIENTPIDIFFRATDLENDFLLNNNLNNGIKFSILNLPTHGTLGDLQENVIGFNQDLQLNSTENWITYTPEPGFIGEDKFTILSNDGNLTGKQSEITIKVAPQNPEIKSQFTTGDLLVADGFRLQWLDPDGTANKISDLLTGHSVSGGAIDLQGNVYIPEYNGGIVSKFDNAGNLIGQFGDKINDYECRESNVNNQIICDFWPTAITFDRNGNAYIGGEVFATDQSRDEVDDIKKFDSSGNLVQKYDVDVLSSGIFGLELGADQCTLHYSSWEGANIVDPNRDIIKRYDVCENRQLTDFANIFQDPLYDELRFSHQPILDFKLMPDGGMIVAHNALIHHLDNSGKIVKTYDFAKGVGNWIAVALDTDGKSFWAAAQLHLYKVDIESGEVLQFFDTDPFGSITGTMVYGEPKPSLTEISPMAIDQNIVVNQNVPIILNLTGFDANRDPLTFSIINQPQNGTLGPITQINSTLSQVIYLSNNNLDTNTDIITYSATDNTGRDSSNIGSIKISINHRPDATDDFTSTLQEVPINIPVLDNDTDSDVINNPFLNDGIHITSVNTTNTLGDVIVNKHNNTVTFVPFSTFSGTDSFTYTISDNNKFTDTANVTVNIQSSNIIPIANLQTVSIVENTPINITLTATDPDSNDTLTFIRGSGPSDGFLNGFNATTGHVQYRPLHNFDGVDSFSFKVFDGKDVSQPGNVTIIVTEDGINDPPVVESERISANVSQQIQVNVLQNDIDPDGDLLTLTNFTGPFNGTAILNQDQTITYQSDPNFNNSDVLYYRVADPTGDYDIGQLIIDIQGNADPQMIQIPTDRLVTTTRNQPVDIGLEATATIDRPLSFLIVDAPDSGTLGDITTLSNLTASIRYTPNSNFQGNDSFTYVAQDANGVTSNIGTIQISVNNIPNNPPIAQDIQVTLDEDKSIQIQLDAFDIDLTDSLTYSIETQPFSGNIVNFNPSNGSLVYQPNPNLNGNDSFLFKAVDQDGLESNIATVRLTVNPVNDPPLANNQQVETNQNTPLQITLAGTDPVDNGDTISQFRIVNNPTNGQIIGFNQNTGILTYTPNNLFFGNDSFTFKVADNNGAESINAATVSIKVNQIILPNISPIAHDKSVETFKNTPIGIQLQGTDVDQGDTIDSYRIVNSPTKGQISNFNSVTGSLTYIPNNNIVGSDSFSFKVTDNHSAESVNAGIVTINIKQSQSNTAPMPPSDNSCKPNNHHHYDKYDKDKKQHIKSFDTLTTFHSDNNNKNKHGKDMKPTQRDDVIIGSSERDKINGLGGNDAINGCAGDDTINGNSGHDGISGSKDDDNINGNEGDDLLFGYYGDDKIHGNEGNDRMDAGYGDDSLFGEQGNDIMIGSQGKDKFSCGSGNDTVLDFKKGQDKIIGSDCEDIRFQS
ncbi:MAG: Ig-like domain-containing protein [Nitrososphaeraceae archaeon]